VLIGKDGTEHPIADSGAPIRNEKGEITGVVLVFRDQTEERAAQRALQESERWYRTLGESLPHLVWTCRADGPCDYLSPRWVAYTGIPEADQLGYRWLEQLHPDDRERVIAEWSEGAPRGGVFDIEFRIRRADGVYRWFKTRAIPLRDNDGRVVKWFGSNTDVDDHVQAVENLRRHRDELEKRVAERTAELQSSKALVDETSKLARVGGWEIDVATNELSWTDVVHEIHEVEPGFRPTLEAGINFYAPEAVPVISEAVRRAIEDGEPFDVELQLITAKKNRIWVRAIGKAIRENGRTAKVRGVFHEINQRKLAEIDLAKHREYLRDRTVQLEETNKELEAFSYSVSHDLRAPLRAIDGFTRILADDFAPLLNTEGKRVCCVIRENTGKMGRLIDDLLAFSRLGRTEMQPSTIDMAALAKAVFYELTTPESRDRIDFEVGPLPAAIGDPSLMRQVWMNLLGNAIKFSSKRDRAVIRVSAQQKDGDVIYAVQDNGAGFDMQYVHKLFGVFQRLHGMREFEGTGVGLALVQRIVRRHGGRVWAEGETDRGATFHFALTERGS
jgi:PAS domain S-box-containing protein